MAITVTDLASDVKKTLGSSFSTEAHPDAKIKTYLNQAQRKIEKAGDFTSLISKTTVTTDGLTEQWTIPYQIQTISVKLNGEPVCPVTLEQYYAAEDNG